MSSIKKHKLNSSERGFTALELMVAMIVSAIVAFLAIPQFSEINASMERMNVRKFLLLDLRRAQAESVTHGCRGIFTISASQQTYTFGCDYLAYDVTSPPVPDAVFFSRNLPTNFFISSDDIIIFNSKGQIVDELGFIDARDVTLSENSTGTVTAFANGRVLGTGLFEYE